jgi:hypothetical protein
MLFGLLRRKNAKHFDVAYNFHTHRTLLPFQQYLTNIFTLFLVFLDKSRK